MKKAVIRHCVGCGAAKEKRELLRAVKSPDGEISIDLSGKKAGRGAYICRCAPCLEKAQKKRALERAFKAPVPQAVLERLGAELEQAARNGESDDG